MKVCHVVHGIVGGGSEQVLLNYGSKMIGEFQFDLIYQYEPNKKILERFEEMGFKCIRIPEKTKHPFKHLIALYQILKKEKYNVVHSHLDWHMNSYVSLIAILTGVPKRLAHHHQGYQSKNILVKIVSFFLQGLTRTFATHYLACAEQAAINGYGMSTVKKGKVKVITNAVDPERFKFDLQKRTKTRTELGIENGTICIGHVGRFYPEKNHPFLITLFYEFYKQNPNSVLLLLGDGPLQTQVKKQVEQLGLSNAVIFTGIQKDTAPFYSAMDVFCFPSFWEGLPLVLVEVQYNLLPAIISGKITTEVKISDEIKWVSLEEPLKWQNELKKITPRTLPTAKINSDKYDINKAYKDLEKIYLE